MPDAVERLRTAGIRLGFLSNMTPAMLEGALARAGLTDAFEHVLSTDRIRSYKPDPRSYQLGVDAFGLPAGEICFAAFAGWDVAGARWFGYPTFWVNRLGADGEALDAEATGEGRDIGALVDFVLG